MKSHEDKIKVAVFARVSTLKSEQDESYQKQIQYYEHYIKESKNMILTKIYAERVSGISIEKRTIFQEMLADASDKKFDMLLVKSISRFGRNTLEGLQAIRKLQEHDIVIKTIEDGFDSTTCDEFTFTLLISLAQKEVEKLSTRIKWGKAQKAKQSLYNGGAPPYGYIRINSKSLAIATNHTPEIIKTIFKFALEGKSTYRIATYLNNNGYPTPSQIQGKKNASTTWHASTVLQILKNPIYCGQIIERKQECVNFLTKKTIKIPQNEYKITQSPYPSIISKSTFENVQKKISKKDHHSSHSSHLYSKMILCSCCNQHYHYKKEKKAYLCGSINHKGKNACHQTNSYLPERLLNELIIQDIMNYINENHITDKLLITFEKEKSSLMKSTTKKISSLRKELKALDKQELRSLSLFSQDHISKNLLEQMLKGIDSQKIALQNTLKNVQEEKDCLEHEMKSDILNLSIIEMKAECLVPQLVEKLIVFPDHIEILYY